VIQPGCHVCGKQTIEAGALFRQNRTGKMGIWACHDHRMRIKCGIEGCIRTTAKTKPDYGYQEWICGVHWRRYCPPRSLRRRAYHRFFRDAKKHGWTERRAAQYWRFWDTLLSAANAVEKNDKVDMTEINKMFGWTDE
jgi:hypothetical protein